MSKRKGRVRTASGGAVILIVLIVLALVAIGFALGYHVGLTTVEIQ